MRAVIHSPRWQRHWLFIGAAAAITIVSAACGERALDVPPVTAGGSSGSAGVTVASGTGTLQPPPATAPPGWREVFRDDFNTPKLSSVWQTYNGTSSDNKAAKWAAGNVAVKDGQLILRGTKSGDSWVTAGAVAKIPKVFTYGGYTIRFRMDNGKGIKHTIMLWPNSERWAAEGVIGISEDNGTRQGSNAFLVAGVSGKQRITKPLNIDTSQWHTVGLVWQPKTLVYYLDGQKVAEIVDNNVSSTPHHLVIKTEAMSCGGGSPTCPDASTPANVNLAVDWVIGYMKGK